MEITKRFLILCHPSGKVDIIAVVATAMETVVVAAELIVIIVVLMVIVIMATLLVVLTTVPHNKSKLDNGNGSAGQRE